MGALNRQKEWYLTALALVYETIVTLSMWMETGGYLAQKVKTVLKEAKTEPVNVRNLNVFERAFTLPTAVRIVFALALSLMLWLLIVKVFRKLSGTQGWGWLAVLSAVLIVAAEALAKKVNAPKVVAKATISYVTQYESIHRVKHSLQVCEYVDQPVILRHHRTRGATPGKSANNLNTNDPRNPLSSHYAVKPSIRNTSTTA